MLKALIFILFLQDNLVILHVKIRKLKHSIKFRGEKNFYIQGTIW